MQNIFWTAYTNEDRHIAINRIEKLVSEYGDIVDVRFFSDVSLTMTIEIQEFKIQDLYGELQKILTIDDADQFTSISKKERILYLNITFIRGTGNLKIEVPSVPG